MRKGLIDYNPSDYIKLDDLTDFVNLNINHLSKDKVNYPIFNAHGSIDIVMKSYNGYMKFGQYEEKPNCRRFTLGSFRSINWLLDVYKHKDNEIYMIRFLELPPKKKCCY